MTYSFQHNIMIIKLFSRHELQDAVWDEVDFLPMCGRGSARFRLTDIWTQRTIRQSRRFALTPPTDKCVTAAVGKKE